MFLLKKRYWISATLLLIVFLVLRSVPASWVIYGVQQAAPGFQVSGVTGSLWRGQADFGQWVDRGKILPLGELQWQLSPWSLLTLNPCVQFSAQATQQTIKGNGCYALLSAKISAEEVDVTLPVKHIAPFFNVDLDGNIDAYINRLIWTGESFAKADFNVLWQRAALYSGSQWVTLGDIQATGSEDASGGLFSQWKSVDTAQRPAPVDIDLEVLTTQLASAQPSFRVTGTIVPGPNANALKPMLQFIGEPAGGGGYRIDVNE